MAASLSNSFIELPILAQASATPAEAPTGLQLNELLASNLSGVRDNFGDSSDWLELHNSGDQAIDLEGFRLMDDRDGDRQWTFPAYQLPPGEHLVVWMSGRENTQGEAPAAMDLADGSPFHRTLIAEGARWHYWTQNSNEAWPGIKAWTSLNFEVDSYPSGRAGFGFEDGDDRTELPRGTTVVLLRHEFQWKSTTPTSLVLRVDYDDGFVAYLNGERVADANAPRHSPERQTLATDNHEAGTAEQFDLSRYTHLLKDGKNVLAMVGLNLNKESSDLSLHPTLGTLAPVFHVNFRLNKKGGEVVLIGKGDSIVDHVTYPKQATDRSWGRANKTDDSWGYFIAPTPNAENTGSVQNQVIAAPSLSPAPGAYGDPVALSLISPSSPEHQLRFTTDGRDPGGDSSLYQGTLRLNETATIRAAVFVGEDRISPITTGTYWIGQRPQLPVLAISMKPEHFRQVQLQSRATGKPSERAAYWEFIDPSGPRIASTGFGLRLHGGAGRNGPFEKKKSYRAYFRKSYGVGRIANDIIPDTSLKKFDKLVLRANSNDKGPGGSNIRDQVIRDLHRDMGGYAAHGFWCNLLINSQNRGVYNVTERMDEEFFKAHLGPGEYDVIKTGETILNGNRDAWNDLRRFIETNNFTDDRTIEALEQQVDIENFTSYVILNLCMQNFDWPHNNWYAARGKPDGRWIFLCWDAEWGLGYRHPHSGDSPVDIALDPYAFMDSGGAAGHSMTRNLFLALMSNAGYRDYYQAEVKRYLQGALSTENILRQVRRHRDAMARDLEAEYIARGHRIEQWHEKVREIEDYARRCPAIFQKHTDTYFETRIQSDESSPIALLARIDGGHQVFHRLPDGTIRQISVAADGNVNRTAPIPFPQQAPKVSGAPVAFSPSSGDWHLIYRDNTGALHELIQRPEDRDDNTWNHRRVAAHLDIPPAVADPSAVVHEQVPHIIYLDNTAQPHELWWDGEWRHHPLPSAPRPGSNLSVSATPEGLHVLYQTKYGAPCEQRLNWHEAREDQRIWRNRLILQVPTAGPPVGLIAGGRWRTVFRAPDSWPLSEPYVFHWDGPQGKGYQEYKGSRTGLVEATDQRQRFHRLKPIGGNGAIQAVSQPTVARGGGEKDSFVIYRDAAGHIHEASWFEGDEKQENGWRVQNLTTLTSAPPAASTPQGLVEPSAPYRCYVYLDTNGLLHELHFKTQWRHIPLTAN